MKKFNYFAMGLLAAATVSFSACSSDDINSTSQNQADGFYMTLTIKTPTSSDTRAAGTTYGTADESDVTSGTFFLVDASGKTVYTKTMAANDWDNAKIPTQNGSSSTNQVGSTTLEIEVEKVVTGAEYYVYFLANETSSKTPWLNDVLSTASKFSGDYSKAKNFVMFNQNDGGVAANSYKVTFKDENKVKSTPAYVNNNSSTTIKLDRLVARIDEPTSSVSEITTYTTTGSNDPSTQYQAAMADAKSKVKSVALKSYAIANLADRGYVMQHWDNSALAMPTEGLNYFQSKDEFGTETKAENLLDATNSFFLATDGKKTSGYHSDYVFENADATDAKATTMYFEYKVTLDDTKFTPKADFSDGTFYRYNNVIYNRISDIYTKYGTVAGIFNKKTSDEVLTEIQAAKNGSNVEEDLSKIRKAYDIEIFNKGLTYYKQVITDSKNTTASTNNIYRNTIYKLNVSTIYNVGADVPNGKVNENALYYLACQVEVNPWVLNEQTVIFK